MKWIGFKTRGIMFGIVGLTGIAIALLNPQFQVLGVGLGVVFFFLAGSTFSKANQIARSLAPFVKKSVSVEVWGLPLPASSDGIFEIASITAFGAGLLIHLRAISGGPRCLLKVAQPGSARLEGGRIEIGEAAYVRWDGTKLKPAVGGEKAPALVLITSPPVQPRPDNLTASR